MAKKGTSNGAGGRGRLDSILSYARDLGYEDAKERGEWKGATVYELILKKGEEAYTGLPQFLLDKGGKVKIASPDEVFDILDSLDEEGEDDV